MTTTNHVLRTRQLGKRYRRNWALRDCDLDLPKGRVIALVGPNGAGKTTLLRSIVGLLEPSTGTVELLGRSPGTDAAALSRVGFLAQEHPLYRTFTIAEMLRFGRATNIEFDTGLVQRRLADLGIPLERRTGQLSGGQQAQVALALALGKRPQLLILDEPVASLDPLARREFLQMLMGVVAEDGCTVLFSSHVVHELERVCDHLVVLNGGRVALAGDIEDLLTEHRLLTGPRTTNDLSLAGTVIEATHSDRHTTLLVRDGAALTAPGWQAAPISLEELVLAYLRRRVPATAARSTTTSEVVA